MKFTKLIEKKVEDYRNNISISQDFLVFYYNLSPIRTVITVFYNIYDGKINN